MFCRVCGEIKDKKEFYRLKHFSRLLPTKKIWCRDCMKMYVEMKKEEEQKKSLEQKEWVFILKFE